MDAAIVGGDLVDANPWMLPSWVGIWWMLACEPPVKSEG
jgi:hypothetical protein